MSVKKPYTDKAMKDHADTYFGFKNLLKYGIGLVVVVLLGLAIFAA
ncbi:MULTISPECIES: aa3-type cytochrome c oxidase subunit IV [Pacificimonas]|uniref:Aa3-type cytochrome c oxidase subunit IV n=1 Tax=Pacificimonas aurantium TaxID=1250540 RepID=A0ABS7WGT2_9SPHN|nr:MULTISPECIES: aa3-type cytochrome c oxidase subunit IV [Pacificimonas]MBZ6377210.1 aa3-type cytochrome c oxidase subunit IV [Pacificimonas aurantium]